MFQIFLVGDDDIVPAQLVLLNYLVPPTGKVQTNKKWWKFSTLESTAGILLHVKVKSFILLIDQNLS